MNDSNNPQDHTQIACTACNYNLEGIDLTRCCPECGDTIITDCFWCDYDLRNTAPESNCPECGVPAATSIGRGLLATVPPDLLRSIHNGFRLVTVLILVYIVWIIVAAVAFTTLLIGLDNSTLNLAVIPISIVSNGLVLAIIYGWWKLAAPFPDIPETIDGSDRRGFLNATLIAFAIVTAITMLVSFIPSNLDPDAPFETIDYVNFVIQAIGVIVMILVYVAQMRYLQWFAKIAKNQKMHKRAKHLVWSGPLIAIVGAFFFLIGPLVVLILYWNMLEYLRRDVKKIIKAKAAFA